MKQSIQPLSSDARLIFSMKADEDAVVVNEAGEVIEQEAQMQSGAPVADPEVKAAFAALEPRVKFHQDHHRTFWPLKTIYEHDPDLALALWRLDAGLENTARREEGYLEKEELEAADTPAQKAAVQQLRDLESFMGSERTFDPRRLSELAERHPALAKELATLDRPGSVRHEHSDSFKVSQLSPEMQARFKKVDTVLRKEARAAAWGEIDNLEGRKIAPWLSFASLSGGIAIGMFGAASGLAFGWFGIPLMVVGAIATAEYGGGGSPDEQKLQRRYGRFQRLLGRLVRPLRYPRRARKMLSRFPEKLRGHDPHRVMKELASKQPKRIG